MVAALEQTETTTAPAAPEAIDAPEMNDGDNARASLPFSGDVVTRGTMHYPERHRDAVRWLFFHCVEEGLRLQEVCKIIKRDYSTISRVMKGDYKSPRSGEPVDLTNIVKDIEKYRKDWEQGQVRSEFRFIKTPVMGEEIFQVCDFAAESATIAFVWGESQTGKSENLKAYHRANNHGKSKYCELMPASGQLMMLREIAKACAISPKTAYDKLLDRIIKSLDKSNLLIVDELHQVTTTYHARSKLNCLELLRRIHDKSGCGMVLCGTNTFRDEVQEGRDKKLLEQLAKRGPCVYQCPDVAPRKDVEAIIAGWKLPRIEEDLEVGKDLSLGELIFEDIVPLRGMKIFLTFVKSSVKRAAKQSREFDWSDFAKCYRVMNRLAQPKKRS